MAGLRDGPGGAASPAATAYDVAALAMAGVPLIAGRPLPSGLDPALGALIESADAAVLADPLRARGAQCPAAPGRRGRPLDAG